MFTQLKGASIKIIGIGLEVMSVTKIPRLSHWAAGFLFIAYGMLALADTNESNIDAKVNKKDNNWAAQVDDRSIQFAAEAEKKSASAALTGVKEISKNVQSLKKDVIALNKNLRMMEEQLLFPSSTKFSVFVSLDTGQFFTLESVKLKIDGKLVATHLYSDRQREAMARGGIQKLYITNINEGKHSATAFFTGIGPNGRPYKRAENLDFEKGPGSGYIEIAITDDGSLQEPVFAIKQW